MDEFPDQAADSNNNIAAKEEAPYKSVTDFISTNIGEEKCCKISSALEALSCGSQAEKSDPGERLFAFQMDLKKNETFELPVLTKQCLVRETASHREVIHPIEYKSFIKQKIRHEIALDRGRKKLEMAFMNRGLPVDRESLLSSANKDPFDLKDLSESLPLTSASNKKQSFHDRARLYRYTMKKDLERLGIQTDTPPYSPRELRLATTASPFFYRFQREPLKFLRERMLLSVLKKNSTTEQNDKIVENILLFSSTQGQETIKHPNFLPGFVEMSPNDKQEEKRKEGQSSDAENNQQSPRLSALRQLELLRVMHQESLITDFQLPQFHASLNNPIKKERTEDIKGEIPTWEKMLAHARQNRLRLLRYQNKFRMLNSRRGVLSSDIDGSETENLSKQASRVTPLNHLDSEETRWLQDVNKIKHFNKHKRLLMNMKESIKDFRSLKSLLSTSPRVKSDLVVPD